MYLEFHVNTHVCMYTLMYTPNIALKEKKHNECMAGGGEAG